MKSVLKASQAISEELELEGILEKLIYSLLECAGAQHIYYVNRKKSEYEIQAEGHSGLKDDCIILKRPAEGRRFLSVLFRLWKDIRDGYPG